MHYANDSPNYHAWACIRLRRLCFLKTNLRLITQYLFCNSNTEETEPLSVIFDLYRVEKDIMYPLYMQSLLNSPSHCSRNHLLIKHLMKVLL